MEFISYIAAILTTVAFVPQAMQVIKTKNTEGISLPMYVIFISGVLLWTIYGLNSGETAVFLANAITFVFASIILTYKIKYSR